MNRRGHARGRWAEHAAAADYRRDGYDIIEHNWRSPVRARNGEIDLICQRDDTIVFCEVKARQNDDHGDASLAVGQAKQRQVRSLAELWLIQAGIDLDTVGVRFDVVSVTGSNLRRIEAAF